MIDSVITFNPLPIVILDALGLVIQVSDGFCDFSGLSQAECKDHMFSDLFNDRLQFIDVEFIHHEILQAMESKSICLSEMTAVNNTYLHLWVTPISENSDDIRYVLLQFEVITDGYIKHK